MTSNNFVLTTLARNPEYFEEVISLIEEEFHYTKDQDFKKDFAPLVDPINFENCYLYIDVESNVVVAHLAVALRTMIKNTAEIEVALIGGIVTNKKYRGKKFFKQLMNHAIMEHQEKVGLFILWSELENLYEKFSFFRTGGLIETGKKNINADQRPPGFVKTKFNELTDEDFNSIAKLYSSFNQNYFFTIKRENKDWSIIREMSTVDLFIKKNNNDEIEQYFCCNKGHDLTNIVHEISCLKINDYPILLKQLGSFKLWLPETEGEKVPHGGEIFYTAFLKIGSSQLLNNFLMSITKNDLKISNSNDEKIYFSFKEKSFEASPKDFLQYVFGPIPLTEFKDYQLSMYIAGMDSI